jgi:PEP-CTERM motif
MGGYARSKFYRLVLSSILALAFHSMQPRDARADSLFLFAETGENYFSIISCSSNSTPTASCGIGSFSATATGSLSTGTVGSVAQAASFLPNTVGQINWEALGYGSLDYVYTVTGTQSGTIDTTLTVNGNSQVSSNSPCVPICFAEGTIGISSTETFGGAFTGSLPNGPFTFTIITPVANGTADFSFGLTANASCPPEVAILGNMCTATADYLDSVTIIGASVYDAGGKLVPDATIVSQSGYSPPSSTPTPEPSSIMLLATGILVFSRLLRRKQA